MKLFLASEVKNPLSFPALTEYVGGRWSNKKILYIPTAANGEQPQRDWHDSGTWHLIQTLGAHVEVLELEKTLAADVPTYLKNVDVIWFAGGMTGYLLYWIRRVKLDTHLPELLHNGCLYVGSSAGSMIASPTQTVTEWYIGETEPGASLLPGLGLVDFEIYPHFSEELLPQIQAHFKGDKLYLLKDGDALIVENKVVKHVGTPRLLER